MKVDLHAHTYFSDGQFSPDETAALAKERGLAYISVCDHNTTAAYPRLRAACEEQSVGLVQGVEIDVLWGEQRLHLLAYGFDPDNEPLMSLIRKARRELDELGDEMARNMAADFPEIDLTEYESYTFPQGRGGWKSINYIFDKGLLDNLFGGLKYAKEYSRYKPAFPAFAEVCKAVRAAGGVNILAHPGCWWKGAEAVPRYLAELVKLGLDGVECFYPEHSAEMTKACVDFCRENGLYITCGGDCHGEFARYEGGADHHLGVMDVDSEELSLWPRFFV